MTANKLLRTKRRTAGKKVSQRRRHLRVRKRVTGSAERPRLVVTRSLRHVTGQIVDDAKGQTLVSASTISETVKPQGDKKAQARAVGEALAKRAREVGITQVVFDRSGYKYQGRVAALAEGARSAGLDF
jgi:large subunit ribosomal protein L18